MTAKECCTGLNYAAGRRKWLDIVQLADYDRANGEFIPDNPLKLNSPFPLPGGGDVSANNYLGSRRCLYD